MAYSDKELNLQSKVLAWLADDFDVGTSSKAMGFCAIGMADKCTKWTPSDPADFNRCLLLVDQIPEIKEHFNKIADMSKGWKSIINNWSAIEKSFIDEVGVDWCKAKSAPITYKLMKDIEAQEKVN